jgi:uncharacterized protein with HEPN domain
VKKDPAVYIRHIHDCILRIEAYVEDGRAAFFNDHKTQDAVIRNREVIGKAVKETLNKSFDRLRTNGKLLNSLVVSLSNHERNQLVQCFLKDPGTERLSAEQPAIPWAQIAGARNVLAHQYLGVDLNLVWNVVEQNLPALKAAMHEAATSLAIDLTKHGGPN